MVSVHDPEMRHGRKSKRFDGHKGALAVDTESQLITAVAVLGGNAPDNEKALELVEQSEQNAEVEVAETIGDCADGGDRGEPDAGSDQSGPDARPRQQEGSSFCSLYISSG